MPEKPALLWLQHALQDLATLRGCGIRHLHSRNVEPSFRINEKFQTWGIPSGGGVRPRDCDRLKLRYADLQDGDAPNDPAGGNLEGPASAVGLVAVPLSGVHGAVDRHRERLQPCQRRHQASSWRMGPLNASVTHLMKPTHSARTLIAGLAPR